MKTKWERLPREESQPEMWRADLLGGAMRLYAERREGKQSWYSFTTCTADEVRSRTLANAKCAACRLARKALEAALEDLGDDGGEG